jgi:hypothetical protein
VVATCDLDLRPPLVLAHPAHLPLAFWEAAGADSGNVVLPCFYLPCGVAGDIVTLVAHPEVQSYGASGAEYSDGPVVWWLSTA